MNKQYVNIDGIMKLQDNFVIKSNNRAFKYGDALFETMFSSANKIPLFNRHIERLINSMKILKMEIPDKFTINKDSLFYEITRLLNKNKLHKGARVRITVYRTGEGLYTPENNNISYLIDASGIENTEYKYNTQGIKIDIFTEILKPQNIFSNLKTTNTLLYILAGIYKKEARVDDVLLLNDNYNVIEALSSNIFIVKDNQVYTPNLEDGCVNGIMRNHIIYIAKKNNISIKYKPLTLEDIESAEEIFLTNSISGIKWVGGYLKKRYYNKISSLLASYL